MKPNKKRATFLERIEKIPVLRETIMFLRKVKKRLLNKRKVYVSDRYNAIYFPITKVASTSVEKVLKKEGFETKNKKEISFSGYKYKFTFVRNPYDRLVSCYIDKIKKPAESGVIAEEPFKLYKDMSFKEFVKAAYSIPDKYADPHFKSQYLFLMNKNGKLIPDFIGKFENLEEDYKKAMKKIGIKNPPKLPHKRKSKRKKNYKEYYDKETKKLVQERYKKDFELFGYSKEL